MRTSVVPSSFALALVSALACSAGGGSSATTDAGPPGSSADGTGGADAGAGADASAEGASAASFDPRTVAGLALWLDAARGTSTDGKGALHWADQSARGLDASRGGAENPTVTANAIGGHPVVDFANYDDGYLGTHQWLQIGSDGQTPAERALVFGSGDFLIELVMKAEPPGSIFFDTMTVGDPFRVTFGPGSLFVSHGFELLAKVDGKKHVTDGAPHLVGALRTVAPGTGTGTIELRADGATDATSTDPAFASDITQASTSIAGGHVAEIIVVIGPSAAASVDPIERYLRDKYRL